MFTDVTVDTAGATVYTHALSIRMFLLRSFVREREASMQHLFCIMDEEGTGGAVLYTSAKFRIHNSRAASLKRYAFTC